MNLLLFNQKVDVSDPGQGIAVDWMTALARRVDRLYVITHELGDAPSLPNVDIRSIGRERGLSRLRRVLEFYRQLLAVVRHDRIDGCFAHMVPIFTVLAAPVLKTRGIPLVQWYVHRATPFTLRLAAAVADHVLTAAPDALSLASRKILVTGHGIDTDHFAPSPGEALHNGTFTVVSVGRISPIKRYEILLDAIGAVRARGNRVRVIFVGGPRGGRDARYLVELQSRCARLGLDSSCHFAGPVPRREVPTWYRQADLAVHVCNSGMDKAVLEAMSCGLPVVTSNPVFKELLRGLESYLVPADTDPRQLADAIEGQMRLDTAERRRVGRLLRERVVAQHSRDRFVETVLSLMKVS